MLDLPRHSLSHRALHPMVKVTKQRVTQQQCSALSARRDLAVATEQTTNSEHRQQEIKHSFNVYL